MTVASHTASNPPTQPQATHRRLGRVAGGSGGAGGCGVELARVSPQRNDRDAGSSVELREFVRGGEPLGEAIGAHPVVRGRDTPDPAGLESKLAIAPCADAHFGSEDTAHRISRTAGRVERIDARESCVRLQPLALPRRPDRTKTLIRCGSPRRESTTHGAYALLQLFSDDDVTRVNENRARWGLFRVSNDRGGAERL